jgi:hypothetical protein
MNKPKKLRKCYYSECALPLNNNCYLWQMGFLFFGFCCLIGDAKQFNLFTIFAFVLPVLIDLFHNAKLRPLWLQNVRKVFILYNIVIVIVCIVGFRGIIIDAGENFVVAGSAMFFAARQIPKKSLAFLILIDIFVPCMFFYGAPNQASMQMLGAVSERVGVKM